MITVFHWLGFSLSQIVGCASCVIGKGSATDILHWHHQQSMSHNPGFSERRRSRNLSWCEGEQHTHVRRVYHTKKVGLISSLLHFVPHAPCLLDWRITESISSSLNLALTVVCLTCFWHNKCSQYSCLHRRSNDSCFKFVTTTHSPLFRLCSCMYVPALAKLL